ncbi:hypothetical protein A4S06_04455 [Erysipelotrichaceae bacterium MTC7]|nr:hypothetical protein A4S06_04455 [Erysipelotrichaceae bacterium MTC7]
MQTFNYHTHTVRCGHAVGDDEEYIKHAIQAGFKTLGFSEHLGYDGWDDPQERIPFLEVDAYFQRMYELKEKYKDQIDLRVGVEFEFFEDQLAYLKDVKQRCDYMIVGQHARNFDHYYDHGCNDEDVDFMAEQVIRALDEKLTKYVAHVDYFMLGKDDFNSRNAQAIARICDAVNRNDAILELNLKGMKYGKKIYPTGMQYMYPHYDVFKIIADKGCKVVFGYDAHHPKVLLERNLEEKALEEMQGLQLHFVDSLEL